MVSFRYSEGMQFTEAEEDYVKFLSRSKSSKV